MRIRCKKNELNFAHSCFLHSESQTYGAVHPTVEHSLLNWVESLTGQMKLQHVKTKSQERSNCLCWCRNGQILKRCIYASDISFLHCTVTVGYYRWKCEKHPFTNHLKISQWVFVLWKSCLVSYLEMWLRWRLRTFNKLWTVGRWELWGDEMRRSSYYITMRIEAECFPQYLCTYVQMRPKLLHWILLLFTDIQMDQSKVITGSYFFNY